MPLNSIGKLLNLNETEKAYIAGIIDGEGCISIAKRKVKYITPSLQISGTNKELISYLANVFDTAVYLGVDGRPNRKQAYYLAIFGQKALNVVREMYPYLRVKKPQADIVLSLKRYDICQNRDKLGRLKTIFTPEIEKENRLLVANIRNLNKQGAYA